LLGNLLFTCFYHGMFCFIIKMTNIFYTAEAIKLFFNIIIFSLSVAPNISSSCSRNRVIACVCEAHGNPCPTLAWRLSGHVLTNSTETSISEEKLGSTGVKSILTTRQSLTDTDVLQCFSTNTHGSASQQFQTFPPPQETSEKHKTTALSDRQDCENEVLFFKRTQNLNVYFVLLFK